MTAQRTNWHTSVLTRYQLGDTNLPVVKTLFKAPVEQPECPWVLIQFWISYQQATNTSLLGIWITLGACIPGSSSLL